MKITIRNIAKSAQGVMTTNGRTWIAAGEVREVDVANIDRIARLPFLEIADSPAASEPVTKPAPEPPVHAPAKRGRPRRVPQEPDTE